MSVYAGMCSSTPNESTRQSPSAPAPVLHLQAISQLPAVMALCSSVFASPGLHEDFLEVYSC